MKNTEDYAVITGGADSEVLAEIKAVDSELAAQIAQSLKLAYETGTEYLASRNENSSVVELADAAEGMENFIKTMNTLDFEATALTELANTGKVGVAGEVFGKALSKVAQPLSVGMSITSYAANSYMLYNENLVPAWENAGNSGGTLFQKLAKIRSQNTEIFDDWIKSNVDVVFSVGGAAAVSLMRIAGVVGAPVIITAGACYAAPIAINWLYDKLLAKKFNEVSGIPNKLKKKLKTSDNLDSFYYKITRLYNSEDNVVFSGTPTNDEMDNSGSNVKIFCGSGNDSVGNYYGVENILVYGGSGNDTLGGTTVYGGTGNDTFSNISNNEVLIIGGSGDDYVWNDGGESLTIDAGAGKDTIFVCGGSTITGGKGADVFVYNGGINIITDY